MNDSNVPSGVADEDTSHLSYGPEINSVWQLVGLHLSNTPPTPPNEDNATSNSPGSPRALLTTNEARMLMSDWKIPFDINEDGFNAALPFAQLLPPCDTMEETFIQWISSPFAIEYLVRKAGECGITVTHKAHLGFYARTAGDINSVSKRGKTINYVVVQLMKAVGEIRQDVG
jgi:hypothetical protein